LNILITPDERACITDFGLSQVQSMLTLGWASAEEVQGPSARYSSAELLSGSNPSLSSDIYAFGCVCYEAGIFERKIPFHELRFEVAVIYTVVIQRRHPSCPDSASLNDTMWEIMMDCWNTEPWERPEASEVLTRVTALGCLTTSGSIKPAPSWD
ncbi:kinase-like protein, partial [Marasmius fiardii PR-910]